ncbi:hira protein Slm9 [Schizosaccharomyces japonicus yFS275]|uniref:Protein HIR n=1 Tax=Schizosaccharomyces japonicus (strain yFS275 / FY16936) TaxID=402676 RepID=B6JX00_SCHJY|nr:hira protein Slm9 [Schizosaccharomyces japonicus yFS275]EEB05901.1 hira protein Slm9 [Schizosaccharomyces japonicus yFS275]
MRIVQPLWIPKDTLNAVSHAGELLAVAGDAGVDIWSTRFVDDAQTPTTTNVETKERYLITRMTYGAAVYCVRFSPDSKWLAVATGTSTYIYKNNQWTEPVQILPYPALDIAWNRLSRVLAIGMKTIHVFLLLQEEDPDVAGTDAKPPVNVPQNAAEKPAVEPSRELKEQHSVASVVAVSEGPHSDRPFVHVKEITGHQSFVCGLTFDPIGLYLASQSHDRTLKIWKLSTFGLEKSIAKPFEDMTLASRFLRLSWSPDGAHIASVNAVNGLSNVIAIVQRDSWSFDINLVGHQGAIECAAFNPHLFNCPFKSPSLPAVRTMARFAYGRPREPTQQLCFTDYPYSNVFVFVFEEDEFGPRMQLPEMPEQPFPVPPPVVHSAEKETVPPVTSKPLPVTAKTTASLDPSTELPSPHVDTSHLPLKRLKRDTNQTHSQPVHATVAETNAQIRLARPCVRPHWTLPAGINGIYLALHNYEKFSCFEVRTDDGNSSFALASSSWKSYLPSSIVLARASKKCISLACEDGVVHIYSPNGRRLLPPLTLASVACWLECENEFVLCITSTGLLYVWNVDTRRAVHPPVALHPLFHVNAHVGEVKRAASIMHVFVTASGNAVVVLSDGNCFSYDASMQTWIRVSEGWWMIGSQYWDTPFATDALSFLERCTDDEIMKQGRGRFLQRVVKASMLRQGYENYETVVSVRHLESRMASAASNAFAKSYHDALILYAKRIAEEGMKEKLEELCRELMGPPGLRRADEVAVQLGTRVWEPTVASLRKRDLLREVLMAVGRQREVQRITSQYVELLDNLEKS